MTTEAEVVQPRRKPSQRKTDEGWAPDLNPRQVECFNASAKFVLTYGERYSGKTLCCLHSLVRHCYETKNALALIIAKSIHTGKEGALHDLTDLVLPTWKNGNKYPLWNDDGTPHPKAEEYKDEGIDLDYTESQQDPDTKHRIIWIGNMHGGWSKVILVSIPYPEFVKSRIKGPAPSFVYLEEITDLEGEEYFIHPAAQLGRRRDMKGVPQQLYASCNPDGPSHWVYKKWWVECVDEETGRRDPDFQVIHIPIVENFRWISKDYVNQLRQAYKDPIERQRMLEGKWVDRPSGNSIFKNYFMPEIHMVGDALKGIGWIPFKSFPIIVSYDPGPVNFSIHMMQPVMSAGRLVWFVFDELNFVGSYTPTPKVVKLLLLRMDYWNKACATNFRFIHIGPEDAFNQQRSDGSYDAMEIEKFGKGRIKLRGVPQARGSVVARIQMLIGMFLDETMVISATCGKTVQAVRNVASKKAEPNKYEPNAGLTPVRSVHVHPIDSLSYAPYFFSLHPGMLPTNQTEEIVLEAYTAGGRR